MISVLFLFAVIWFGLILDDWFGLSRGDLPVRLAAAVALGCFWSAWLVFLLSWVFGGLGDGPLLLGLALILGFNVFFWKTKNRNASWLASLRSLDRPFWLACGIPVVLLTVYFSVCVRFDEVGNIRFDGNTQDLSFHMATVSAFLNQDVFPPLNPQSGAAKLSYHFIANFFSAVLCKGGFSLFYSLKIPMVLAAFSLCTLVGRFFFVALKSRAAACFAGLLFFFGHVGVINLIFGLCGYPSGNGPVQLSSWTNVEDHLVYPYYNFLNVIIDYFQPQLPFLIALPLGTLVLLALYRLYTTCAPLDKTAWFLLAIISFFPLFHIHSFLTICPLVGLFILFTRLPSAATVAPARPGQPGWLAQWLRRTLPPEAMIPDFHPPRLFQRDVFIKTFVLLLAGLPVAIQLAFIFSQPKAPGFSGFDVATQLGALPELPSAFHLQRVFFWIRSAGLPFVLGLLGFLICLRQFPRQSPLARRETLALATLFAVGAGYFVIINFYRFSPNWGDSNKFFLYWNLSLCAYAGWLLARLWERSRTQRILAVLLLAFGALIPSAVEARLRLSRESETLFTASDQLVADWIKINTPRDAVFLTANTVVHFVPALAGRRVVNGAYTRETGFADDAIEDLVTRAYRECDPSLITSIPVNYVIIGPKEEGRYHINRATWARRHRVVYDQVSLGVRYSIYEVRAFTDDDLRREREADAAREFIWLSELTPDSVKQFGILRYDQAFSRDPLTLGTRVYPNGLGTHAPSEIHFALDGRYTTFESTVGVDDSQIGGIGSVVFEVWVDDRLAFTSRKLRAGNLPEVVSVNVTDARRLKLVVTDAGDDNHGDHADWAGARLFRRLPAAPTQP